MSDDEREDTATGISPGDAPHPSMEEEFPTSITTSPILAIEQALEDESTAVARSPIEEAAAIKFVNGRAPAAAPPAEPVEPASDDGPTGIAKAPSKPDEHSPADDDGPTSISRVELDDDWEPATAANPEAPDDDPHEDGPTGVTKVDLPPPDEVPTGRTARPANAVSSPKAATEAKKPVAQDPEEDSVVTLQKPVPNVIEDESVATIQPATAKSVGVLKIALHAKSSPKLVAAVPPPRPKEATSDIYDVDDDKTERRDLPSEEINRAIARAKLEPVAISELPDDSPTARRADLAITPKTGVRAAQLEEDPEPATETDLAGIVRRTLEENAMRPQFGSEADNAVTEPLIDKETQVPRATHLMNTASMTQKLTQKDLPPPRPPEQSLGTDSYTFQGGAGELQAVIPVTTGAHKAQAGASLGSSPPSIPLILSASRAPATQSMALHPAPAGYPQPPSSVPQLLASTKQSAAMLPTAASAFPPGLPPGALQGTLQPASGPPSGRMLVGGTFPPAMGSTPNAVGLPVISNAPRAPGEEPRWIVLVLGVLAVCILIPAVLYVVLRPRPDEAATDGAAPVRAVVTIQTAQPKDVPRAERRR